MKRRAAFVRTLKQARAYILQVGICGIFSDAGVDMPNLWDAVDLPDRQPGVDVVQAGESRALI